MLPPTPIQDQPSIPMPVQSLRKRARQHTLELNDSKLSFLSKEYPGPTRTRMDQPTTDTTVTLLDAGVQGVVLRTLRRMPIWTYMETDNGCEDHDGPALIGRTDRS